MSPLPPRIVHVLGYTGGSGAENQALYLLRALREHPFRLELVYFYPGRDHDQFAALGIPMHFVQAKRRLALDLIPRALDMTRRMKDDPPAIIHAWLFDAHLVALLGAVGRSQAKIVLAHRSSWGAPRDRRHLLAMRPLRRRIDHVVANSPGGAEMMIDFGLDPGRVSVIANGLPPDRVAVSRDYGIVRAELEVPVAAPLLCAVTRPDVTKDIPTLIRAFELVRAARPDVRLVLVGPTADELAAMEILLPEGAQAAGFQERPVDFMNSADVVVLSSRSEGHSNVADEALMLGLPVASTDVGGHAELVRQAGGRTVPVSRPDLLATAVLELLEHPPAREQVRAVAEVQLSIDGIASQTAQLYADLISAPH